MVREVFAGLHAGGALAHKDWRLEGIAQRRIEHHRHCWLRRVYPGAVGLQGQADCGRGQGQRPHSHEPLHDPSGYGLGLSLWRRGRRRADQTRSVELGGAIQQLHLFAEGIEGTHRPQLDYPPSHSPITRGQSDTQSLHGTDRRRLAPPARMLPPGT